MVSSPRWALFVEIEDAMPHQTFDQSTTHKLLTKLLLKGVAVKVKIPSYTLNLGMGMLLMSSLALSLL